MQGVDRILGGDLNFYSPFYRQVTMETYADSALIARRFPLAMEDVRKAFRYYVDHLSGGRPFVLAGFSQGGEVLVELLKRLGK
jgi:acetyl esterase/lipase